MPIIDGEGCAPSAMGIAFTIIIRDEYDDHRIPPDFQ